MREPMSFTSIELLAIMIYTIGIIFWGGGGTGQAPSLFFSIIALYYKSDMYRHNDYYEIQVYK